MHATRPGVVRERLESDADPLAVAGWLRGAPRAVALSGSWAGGGLLLSSHPLVVARVDDDAFAALDQYPPGIAGSQTSPGADGADGAEGAEGAEGAVGGGWFGWLGFGLARTVEELPPSPPRPLPLPQADLAFHDHVVRCDAQGRWWFEALLSDRRAAFLDSRLRWWRERLARKPPQPVPFKAGPLRVTGTGAGGHGIAVAEAVARIYEGELSQANICMRLEGEFEGHALDLWAAAIRAARPAFGAYIAGEGHAVVSLSPELFLRRRERVVSTRPIKGTAPQESDPAALRRSPKDRAENVMIVDLMRNDLGRVCEYGSIEVERLYEVEAAAGVWQLVSTVRGRLRPGVGDAELLRATFPPGSVTGAPKIEALRVISQLESTAREVYCGAIGFRSPLAGLELSVAIRTFELTDGRVWLGAGGGVVSDSTPAGEVEEALRKAAGVADAAGIAVAPVAYTAAAARTGPAILRGPRPDPAAGVIETIRVVRGRAVDLHEHLDRLDRSARALGLSLPPGIAGRVRAGASALGDGGLRIHADGDAALITTRAAPAQGATPLEPVVLPGGLGAHKWADRALVDSLSAAGASPLFCDLDGIVLEAGYAAVAIMIDETLVVPGLDGRLLPSISREHLLAAAIRAGLATATTPFSLDQARSARALILTSSLRGPHPGLLDGGPLEAQSAAVCRLLSSA